MLSRWLFLGAWLVACGSPPPVAKNPVAPPPRVRAVPEPARPPNTLYRDEVIEAHRVGLGHFFTLVDLEPVGDLNDRGRMADFKGFKITALRPADVWLAFDFAPGDILTHINGVSVEHYSTWQKQFESLKDLDQVQVDLIRNGAPKNVVIRIVDRHAKSTPNTRTKSPASAAGSPAPAVEAPKSSR